MGKFKTFLLLEYQNPKQMKTLNWFALCLCFLGCKTPEEKRKIAIEEESTSVLARGISHGSTYGYFKQGEDDSIMGEWIKINFIDVDKGLVYANKIKRIIDSGRAPTKMEWDVSNADPLERPVDIVSGEEKEKQVKMLKKPLRLSVDDMKATNWYYATSTPKYANRNSFHVYLGEKGGDVWLRFKIQYYAEDWLFINVYRIKADTSVFEINPTLGQVEHDSGDGKIWETYEEGVTKGSYDMLRKIASAKSVKVRFEGKYYQERLLSAAEKKGIGQVLDLFDAMGGNFKY